MIITTDLRCLKFSMNCAACVSFWRILCGTLTLAVITATSAAGFAGTGTSAHSDSMPEPR